WLPAIMWRLDKNWKALRSTTPWLTRRPSEIIQDHIMLTTQPIEEPDDINHFRQVLEMFDAEKMLMFSSDYPHWDGDTPDFALRQLPSEMRDAVMYRNALEVFKIKVPQHAV
ncbi:MAG: amidohydrolase family protein, partial [Chloroflexi bacterium]|nr:amidohydrolase family protein [Chloroflexota bacterium]